MPRLPRPSRSTTLKLAYVGLAAVDTWLSASPSPAAHRARRLTKPLLMPTLAASLLTDERAKGSPLRTTTLVAQAAGWGGDVALLRDDSRAFTIGSASFAVGHAAYITGFLRNRGRRSPVPAVGTAASWLLTAPVMVVGAAKVDRRLGPTIAAYSGMLAGMVAASSQLDPRLPRSATTLSLAGASTFMASDSVLGLRKFVLSDPPRWLEPVVMATYTGAQLLLAEGAARAGA